MVVVALCGLTQSRSDALKRGAALGFSAQVKTKTRCRTLQFSIAGTLIIPFPLRGRASV